MKSLENIFTWILGIFFAIIAIGWLLQQCSKSYPSGYEFYRNVTIKWSTFSAKAVVAVNTDKELLKIRKDQKVFGEEDYQWYFVEDESYFKDKRGLTWVIEW